MEVETTAVAIVGGGPSGLMAAIELGCRGVPCVVLEQASDGPSLPKANATSSRTMEHFRRRGFADEIRALGLPADYPQDVAYCTRLSQHELARFAIPAAQEARSRSSFGDFGEHDWPTPELPHRGQQMYIEPVLRRHAQSHASVSVRFGAAVTAIEPCEDADGAGALVRYRVDGVERRIRARWVVGCDGARSLVRETMATGYSGRGAERREFMGGQMVSIYFRSASLRTLLSNKRPAWQYWAVNGQQRGLLNSINGDDLFVLLVQLREGQAVADFPVTETMHAVVGAPFDVELHAVSPWNAGYALVADRYRSGPLLIAGDAAHLFTPTGGMGYNTSVDDVVNLCWKLAAVWQGWAPESLVDSYEAERRPIAHRNTSFARSMADSIGLLPVPPELEDDGPRGIDARERLGAALRAHMVREWNIPGLQLGVCYAGSPAVAQEEAAPPPDDPNRYEPSGYPGARAPHAWIDGQALFDSFGRDFTLLHFGHDAAGVQRWVDEAARMGMPLKVVACRDAGVRALYGADCVLIRPDHHIAWRGTEQTDPRDVLRLAVGHRVTSSVPLAA